MKLVSITVALILYCFISKAAYINPNGKGQVLIYPYYTVNNGMNTLVTITNNKPEAKAVKVNIHEADNMDLVLSFNVYIDGHDIWTFAIVPTTSTIHGFEGQDTAMLLSSDKTCAPYLNKNGQELLPLFLDDLDLDSSVERTRHGIIQVFEMAEVSGEAVNYIKHISHDYVNCIGIEDDWNDGNWDLGGLSEAKGGLSGQAILVNPYEGTASTYNATAINEFYKPGEIIHSAPYQEEIFHSPTSSAIEPIPSLNHANPISKVFHEGVVYESEWQSGAEAISALFMKSSVSNEYIIGDGIDAMTEWVLSFPTKRYHVNDHIVDTSISPFPFEYDENEGSCSLDIVKGRKIDVYDRNTIERGKGGVSIPLPPVYVFCWASNVIYFYDDAVSDMSEPGSHILGAKDNQYGINAMDYSGRIPRLFVAGKAVIQFDDHSMTDLSDRFTYTGLPIMGFRISKFGNANAQQGLLARYSILNLHQYSTNIILSGE